MDCPKFILDRGTKVTTGTLDLQTKGILVEQEYISARRPNASATLGHPVGGHGGDLYWATHEDGTVAVYCWSEFELVALDD